MSDAKDDVLDRAEGIARRLLEKIGSTVDEKIPEGSGELNARALGVLASRIERLIESSLKEDENGGGRISPNRFAVLLTYEETSKLTPQSIESAGKELTELIREYIGNRRYRCLGTVCVTVRQDLFAKETTVKATFESDETDQAEDQIKSSVGGKRTVRLRDSYGRIYQAELSNDAAPAYVGRSAESRIRIDDPSLSRLHCSLSLRSNGDVILADLGSANGTTLNAQLLGSDDARVLKPDDVIELGELRLTVLELI